VVSATRFEASGRATQLLAISAESRAAKWIVRFSTTSTLAGWPGKNISALHRSSERDFDRLPRWTPPRNPSKAMT
jgi:hypothetical protein